MASSPSPEPGPDRSGLELLRPAEVAVLFQCSPKHIYTLIQRGELEAMRLVRDLRVSRVAVERYIHRSTQAYTSERRRSQQLRPMRGKTYRHPIDDDLVFAVSSVAATDREHGPAGAANQP